MNNIDYNNHLNRKRDNGIVGNYGNSLINKPLNNPFDVNNHIDSGFQSGPHNDFAGGSNGAHGVNANKHQANYYNWSNQNLNGNCLSNPGVGGNNVFSANVTAPIGGVRNNDISDNLFSNLGGTIDGGNYGNSLNNEAISGNSCGSFSSQNNNNLSGYISNLNSNSDKNTFGLGFESVSGKIGNNNTTSTNDNTQSFTSQFENNNSNFGILNFNNNTTSQLVMGIVSNTVKETAGLNSEKISQLQLWFPQTIASLKSHFVVSHEYVLKKLLFMICPFITFFTHGNNINNRSLSYENYQTSISSRSESDMSALPTLFSDLYIPLMGFITYVLADGVINGVFSQFNPQILGSTATFSIVLLIAEIILFQLVSYIFAGRVLTTLDLFSSMGYKYTSIVLCDIILLFIGGKRNHVFWFFFIYISLSSSLVVYLMLKVISNHKLSNQYSMIQQSGLTFVIIIFSIIQIPLCWILLPSV